MRNKKLLQKRLVLNREEYVFKLKSGEIPKFNNIKEVLYNSVKLYKDNIAFTIKCKENEKIRYINKTYEDFLEDVNSFGTNIYDLGLENERIAILGENRYEWAVAYLSNLLGGIVSVPLDKDLQIMELEESLIRSKVKAIVFDRKHMDLVKLVKVNKKTYVKIFICMDKEDEFINMQDFLDISKISNEGLQRYICHNVDSEEMSVLLFTSGTTSKSKAVMLNQKGIAVNIYDMLKVEGFTCNDTNIAILPFHHIFGSTGLLVMLAAGIKTVFPDGLRHIKDNLKEYKVSVFVGVPILIEKMYQAIIKVIIKNGKLKTMERAQKISNVLMNFKIDIRRKLFRRILDELGGNLRLIISGGAALDKELVEKFTSFGVDVVQGYGLTETSPVIAAENVIYKKAGSVGVPMESVMMKIIDKDEEGIGEICVKGPNIMLGYYGNEDATKEVLKDGWFYTGDLGYMDKNGYIFLTGRKKDVIVLKNGKKVFPDELENLINRISGIEEAFVYGKPNTNDINDLTISAKVVYNKENIQQEYGKTDENELYNIIWEKIKEINKTLPKYKYIKNLILTQIPLLKTTTNKIKRNEELKNVLEH